VSAGCIKDKINYKTTKVSKPSRMAKPLNLPTFERLLHH